MGRVGAANRWMYGADPGVTDDRTWLREVMRVLTPWRGDCGHLSRMEVRRPPTLGTERCCATRWHATRLSAGEAQGSAPGRVDVHPCKSSLRSGRRDVSEVCGAEAVALARPHRQNSHDFPCCRVHAGTGGRPRSRSKVEWRAARAERPGRWRRCVGTCRGRCALAVPLLAAPRCAVASEPHGRASAAVSHSAVPPRVAAQVRAAIWSAASGIGRRARVATGVRACADGAAGERILAQAASQCAEGPIWASRRAWGRRPFTVHRLVL